MTPAGAAADILERFRERPHMDSKRAKSIRKTLGLTEAQMGRVLRLKPANAFKTIQEVESGERECTGPMALALEALAAGWRPKDFDKNVKGGFG
jgi:transcriptional regulator with XRE-family HTH domain